MSQRIQIEFIAHHYGKATLFYQNERISVSRYEVGNALKKAGEPLWLQYGDGCTVFYVTKKQLEIIKNYFLIKGPM